MKISLEWLGDYVNWIETDPEKIADGITKGVGEIDEVEQQGKYLKNVVVGKVKNLRKHPGADKLSICDVETGDATYPLVCGGTNLKEGMLVALAKVGATVKHGHEEMTLAAAKIRGETSEGMICAAEELDLSALYPPKKEDGERAIIDLSDTKWKVGTELRDALKMNDVVFHIDNHAITNRPDLFSHIGVARECVALGLATWKNGDPTMKAPSFGKGKMPFAIKNEIPDRVPRYMACMIDIGEIGETPEWMKRRLEATGWRSINPPIDITNYVTMEVGMPMHSFDADDLKGDLHICLSKKDEVITTLDKAERKLPEGAIVIRDDEGIFDLLGIMGGLRSSTKSTTKHILLHSAIVDAVSVRKTIIATGHRTDAATVYEKGVPHITCEQGFYRAIELFLSNIPGAKIISQKEGWGDNGKATTITIDTDRINKLIGEHIEESEIKRILTTLGNTIEKKKDTYAITTPLWRHDLNEDADIVEEVARIHGYNKIVPQIPMANTAPPNRNFTRHIIRDTLKEEGFMELMHLSFTSPQILEKCDVNTEDCVTLENPIGEELSVMRPRMFPQILETIAANAKHFGKTGKVYEVGKLFTKKSEAEHLTAVIFDAGGVSLYNEPALSLKASMFHALHAAGYPVFASETKKKETYMHPGRTVDVVLGDKAIGVIFEVHPQILERFSIKGRVAVFALHLETMLALPAQTKIMKTLPMYPAVTYDETIVLQKKSVKSMTDAARKGHELLKGIETVDVYASGNDKRVTLRFTYRSNEKTLTEDEAQKAHADVMRSFSR